MTQPITCTVVIAGTRDEDALISRSLASIPAPSCAAPITHFAARVIEIPDRGENGSKILSDGLGAIASEGSDWIFWLEPGEEICVEGMNGLGPALERYDVIWGALRQGPDQDTIAKITLFACHDEVNAYHLALNWWVGRTHLVRTDRLMKNTPLSHHGPAAYAVYYAEQWQQGGCLKTTLPLSKAVERPSWSDAERDHLLALMSDRPGWIKVRYGRHLVELPFTGRNPTLERVQLRGTFYEQGELAAVAQLSPPNPTVVDIGANTGNHTAFFASVMAAAKVIPLEPNPDTIAHLRRMLERNDFTNVDTRHLGIAVGAEDGHAELQLGRRGHLGTARTNLKSSGKIAVKPLDSLIDEPVHVIKIDVESGELDALAGATNLIKAHRPLMLVEVQDINISEFHLRISELGYKIAEIFPDQGYANYLIRDNNKSGSIGSD